MKVIYVDDEQSALETFRVKTREVPGIESLNLFSTAEEVIDWVQKNQTDVAFLDIEMMDMDGIELAGRLQEIDGNIRIFFMTAYEQYALDAFGVNALGYIMKPYTKEEIQKALERAALMRSRPQRKVEIQTIPDLLVRVDGKAVKFAKGKQEELLALLIDRGEVGITSGEALACLWPDKAADDSAKTVYRVTMHRLMERLKDWDIDFIVGTDGNKKFIHTDLVECDLYRILSGDVNEIRRYYGVYLRGYAWAEERIAQLNKISAQVNEK